MSGVDFPAPWLNGLLELPLRLEAAASAPHSPSGESLILLAEKRFTI